MNMSMSLLFAVLMAAGAPATDDSAAKIAWIRDPQFALSKAKVEGRPAMLFFTAEWCGYCRQLGATALADEKVVAASQRMIPVFLDCTKKGDHGDLMARYKVQAFPTILYIDPEGAVVREMESRDASAIVKDIDVVVGKVAPRTTIWQPSVPAAKEAGKKGRKPIAVYLVDPRVDLLKVNVRLTKDLGDRKTKFVWVLESGQAATLKKYEAEAPATIVVIDSKTDEVVAKIPFKDDDKAEVLTKALDDAVKLLKK